MRQFPIPRLAGVGMLALAGALTLGPRARAQYATTIPLKPWTAAYEAYSYPIMPTDAAIPNATRYRGASGGPNQLNQYYAGISNSMEAAMSGLPPDAPDVRGRMIPYTSGYRRFDQEFNRVYQPNRNVDAKYYQARNQRDLLFIQATTASDPAKRAEALRRLREFDEKNQSLVGFSRRLEGAQSPLSGVAPSATRRMTAPAAPGARQPAPAPSRNLAPPPPPSSGRPTPAPSPSATAPETAEDVPLFAQSYGGMPTLNPYTSRIPAQPQRAAPRPGAASRPGPIPPAPDVAPSPDSVLQRSRNLDIPPPPEP